MGRVGVLLRVGCLVFCIDVLFHCYCCSHVGVGEVCCQNLLPLDSPLLMVVPTPPRSAPVVVAGTQAAATVVWQQYSQWGDQQWRAARSCTQAFHAQTRHAPAGRADLAGENWGPRGAQP